MSWQRQGRKDSHPRALAISRDWLPISTAPHNGERIKLLIPYDPTRFSEEQRTDYGRWEAWPIEECPSWARADGGCWRFDGDDGPFDIQPTHWMPPTVRRIIDRSTP